MQSCPGDGSGDSGGGTPPPPDDGPTTCPEAKTSECPQPPAEECDDCNAPEEADADICPQPLMGRTLPYLVNIAGRNHEFQFSGTMWRVDAGRSPSTYNISGPHASKDNWWIAESGTIRLVCWGRWVTRSFWYGTVVVQDDDLHFVMAPGHPDFETQPPYPPTQ